MIKILFVSLLLTAGAAQAQVCEDIGWTNQGVLKALLEQRAQALTNVQRLWIFPRSQKVCYRLQGSLLWRHVHYTLCGRVITFSASHRGCSFSKESEGE